MTDMNSEQQDEVKSGLISTILRDYVESDQTQKFAINSVVFGSVLVTLFTIAVAVYAIFYAAYMPGMMHSIPVYLQYHGKNQPSDVVSLRATQDLMKQQYDVSVKFVVPLSNVNFDLGNFMVGITLLNEMNTTLHASQRPALVPYKTPLLRWLSTVWCLPSLLTGWRSETESFSVTLLVGVDLRHISHAIVMVSNPKFQMYSAELVIQTKFQGLAYFMYHWWFTSALFFISIIMLAEIILLSSGWSLLSELLKDDDGDEAKTDEACPSPVNTSETNEIRSVTEDTSSGLPALISEPTNTDDDYDSSQFATMITHRTSF